MADYAAAEGASALDLDPTMANHGRELQSSDGGLIGGLVTMGIILALALWIFSSSFYIVHQAEGMVIERFGKFNKVLYSGWNWVFPFIDQPRSITWRKTYIGVGGQIQDEAINATRIDLRESMFNFMKQEVYTRDTVLLDVNSLMFYRIFDIHKAAYEVEDLQSALSNTAQTQLKEVFGKMTFSEALASQRSINDHLVNQFSKLFLGWGIHVERMELLDLVPKSIGEAMKKQMVRPSSGHTVLASSGKRHPHHTGWCLENSHLCVAWPVVRCSCAIATPRDPSLCFRRVRRSLSASVVVTSSSLKGRRVQ